jgi:hypothetical protein
LLDVQAATIFTLSSEQCSPKPDDYSGGSRAIHRAGLAISFPQSYLCD